MELALYSRAAMVAAALQPLDSSGRDHAPLGRNAPKMKKFLVEPAQPMLTSDALGALLSFLAYGNSSQPEVFAPTLHPATQLKLISI